MSTASTIASEACDHVLDAIALNHAQSRALMNLDTEETDSLLEAIARLPMSHTTRTALLQHAAQVIALNEHEATSEKHAAGLLEQAGRRAQRPRIKWIAAELRPLLHADWATDGTSYVKAYTLVQDLLANPCLPAGTLTGRTLAHELGDGPARKLADLVQLVEAA